MNEGRGVPQSLIGTYIFGVGYGGMNFRNMEISFYGNVKMENLEVLGRGL